MYKSKCPNFSVIGTKIITALSKLVYGTTHGCRRPVNLSKWMLCIITLEPMVPVVHNQPSTTTTITTAHKLGLPRYWSVTTANNAGSIDYNWYPNAYAVVSTHSLSDHVSSWHVHADIYQQVDIEIDHTVFAIKTHWRSCPFCEWTIGSLCTM